jgi:hypothetical protein
MEELRAEVVDFIGTQVALAADGCAAIVEATVEYLDGTAAADDVREVAWQVVDAEFAAHLAAQESWPEATDSDRLTLAFRDLDVAGIVARESFTCCNTCGHAEIADEIPRDEKRRGYVFYHQQDAERAAYGGELWLSYGGREPTAIAGEVVDVLRARGLNPVWGGSPKEKIRLPMDWRRRRLGQFAAHPGTIKADDFTVNLEILGPWTVPDAPARGAVSAQRLAALHLAWLPAGTRVGLAVPDGSTLVVGRSWDRLVGELTRPAGAVVRYEVDWMAAWALVALLGGESFPPDAAQVCGEPLVEVTYDHSAGQRDSAVLMGVAESVRVLREMPVRTGSWAAYAARSGAIVQHRWEPGPRLWMETPDPAANASRGRHVTIAEAEHVITALIADGTVTLADHGDLTTVSW